MPESSTQLDLSQLAVDRSQPAQATVKVSRRWVTRYVLPASILAGFASLFAWAARDSFLPAQPITITPVVVSRAEVKQEGAPLFQAAGWVEPRPTPVVASALAPGVIQEMLVIEGQKVEAGQPVARLIDTDSKLALAKAKSDHTLQAAEVHRAEAALAAAKTNLAKPLSLQASLADAETLLSKTKLELSNLPFAIEAALTRKQLAADSVRRKGAAGDAISGRVLRESRAELATATSAWKELLAREPALKAQQQSLDNKRIALAEKLRLLTDEVQALAEAEANLMASKARFGRTKLSVESAQLSLERMTVRAPITGRVLSLAARPGQRLSGINPHSSQGSSAVVTLYDPASLQVRVDVRLEDVPQVQLGQPAFIESAALPGAIDGRVISVTTLADIQKNTLQVKVAIANPPEVIKPEMLSKVTFLAPPSPVVETETGESPLRLFVPQSLVATGEGGNAIWVADLTAKVAKRQAIEIGRGTTDDGLVEVTSGLNPTAKLIVGGREALIEGARIRVTGEDQSIAGSISTTRTALASGSEN